MVAQRPALAAYVQHGGPPCPAVWDRASGEVRTYPDAHVRPFFGFEVPSWTPDSSALVLKLLATGKRGEGQQGAPHAAVAPVRVYSFRPDAEQRDGPPETLPGWADGYICDLALVDVGRNEVRVLGTDRPVPSGGGERRILRPG